MQRRCNSSASVNTYKMKKKLLYFALIAFALFSCNGSQPEPDPSTTIDLTLDKRSYATEDDAVKTAYETYYKPSNAVTGDPMTYYNESDKTFYVYFLLGRFSGYSKGGIYLTKTKDFAKFTPAIPIGQILTGDQGTYDASIGTGSCIKKDNSYHFFYTGFSNASVVTKAVNSNDLSTAEWIKKPSLQQQSPDFCKKSEFRDPSVYWDETRNKYVMVVGGQTNDNKAVLVRYQSDDLNTWEEIQSLYRAVDNNNPQVYEFPTDTDIPECPEVFKMGSKWYLFFSRINRDNHRKTFYRVADNPNGPWKICSDENGNHETIDGLWLYAAKTVSDGTNRYITGWASVGQDKQVINNELVWGGNLITHKLVQQPSGKLYPAIPDAVNSKFSTSVDFKDIKQSGNVSGSGNTFTLKDGGKVVFNRNVSSFKIEMKVDASQAQKNFGIGFGAYETQQDTYNLTFDMTSNNNYNCPALFMYHNSKEYNFTPLIVPANKQFDVKIIVDKQLCVMYINGNVAFTNHISNMEKNPWMIFANEGTVKFSDIKIYKQ